MRGNPLFPEPKRTWGTRFLKEAGFPSPLPARNFHMASGTVNRVSNVGQAFQPADFSALVGPVSLPVR